MSLKKVTSPEKNISVLELHIDKAAFDDAVMKSYKKNVGKMNVPGFRKGKAPKSIIEKMYGAAVFYDDALEMLLPSMYASAVEEAKLEVVSRPEIDIVSIDDGGVELTAKVYTNSKTLKFPTEFQPLYPKGTFHHPMQSNNALPQMLHLL